MADKEFDSTESGKNMKDCWDIDEPLELVEAEVGDAIALFDNNTGNTLVFDLFTAGVLHELVERAPVRMDELLIAMKKLAPDMDDNILDERLSASLKSLEQQQLIRRIRHC